MSVFLWGPPGTGKTTIAFVVSQSTNRRFVEISAVTAGVKEVRAILDQARRDLRTGKETVLFVDEVHSSTRPSRTFSCPLWRTVGHVDRRHHVQAAIPLAAADPQAAGRRRPRGLLDRALDEEQGLAGAYELDDDARSMILRLAVTPAGADLPGGGGSRGRCG